MAKKKVKRSSGRGSSASQDVFRKHPDLFWLFLVFFLVAFLTVFYLK